MNNFSTVLNSKIPCTNYKTKLRMMGLVLVGSICLTLAHAQTTFTKGPTPWPEIPAPPKAKLAWVSDDMRLNGIPMRIQTFESDASKEEVVSYYVAQWKALAAPDTNQASRGIPHSGAASIPADRTATVTKHGNETIIARLVGPFYSMVKIKDAGPGRSEGTISNSLLKGIDVKLDPTGLPAPQDAVAVNVVEAIDQGKRNKQVLFLSKNSLSSAASYYENHLKSNGWNLLQEQSSPASAGQPAAVVRMYAKDQQQLDVAIGVDMQRRLTVINANLITQTNP
jgi:hypothetical protein